jgi:AhpD family alkylhydroperoxidase
MGEGALDPLTEELIYIAVSAANGCSYCIHSHTSAAKQKGMTEAQHMHLLAIIGMASETTTSSRPCKSRLTATFWSMSELRGSLLLLGLSLVTTLRSRRQFGSPAQCRCICSSQRLTLAPRAGW